MATSHVNEAYEIDVNVEKPPQNTDKSDHKETILRDTCNDRATWGKSTEFLMSCIAMSVGLGNVWRFPFTALENGGGAFLVPYLIVLFLVGKPIYYLEMIIGQFSSRGAVKVFDLCPAMRGIGIGQVISISLVSTYYVAIMGITLRYLFVSFQSALPWTECNTNSYKGICVASNNHNIVQNISDDVVNKTISSAELYFIKEVLHEKENINGGIGTPNWELVVGLLISWICIFAIIRRGVKSSGKFSYFLAVAPYVIMGILLVRAITLPGAGDGIIYFIRPNWSKIFDPKVWYAAVTQCFYSLSVCFGNIIMYASYNCFGHNVYRDATIVTALDTFTSLLAGVTIFGILGNLAYETGIEDIGNVVKGGTGLAFISYPDAIAKFKTIPQIFSVLFFLMLFTLGIGSNIAMTSCTVTSIRDNFPNIKQWHCALAISVMSFIVGLIYVTPGGQYMITLVDYYAASMVALVLGIAELYCLGWIYGINRLCIDAEFMMRQKIGTYFRICWAFVTPLIMTIILIYFLTTYKPLTYNSQYYPDWAYVIGWLLAALGILQLPIWLVVAIVKHPACSFTEKIKGVFRPKNDWGPADPILRDQYNNICSNENLVKKNSWYIIKKNIFG